MKNYPKKTIGELCDIVKGETGIASAIPGEYTLVTTGKDRKTSASYQFDTKAVCLPLISSSGHGKKSLNYVHYQEGKFALGTILAAIIPKNDDEISAAFLHQYLLFYKDSKIVPLMRGAANVSLAVKDVAKIEIPLPPINEQKDFIIIFNKLQEFKNKLVFEFNKQEKYVSQLKQTILQEAIAGQLTTEWRTQNPMQKGNPDTDAAALLAKIKTEKQQLIADGKLKKEKPLAEIAINEIPFPIPDSWVWCRLVEIAEGFEYGSSTKSVDSGKVPVLRMGNLQNGLVDFKSLAYTNDDNEIEQYALSYGDLLFNRTNSRELVGKTSLFLCNEKMIYAGYLVRYRMLGTISFHYANYVMNSQLHRDWCYVVKIDAIGQSNINATKLRGFPFPLPPLAEQKAIVEKVDRLMNIIEQLEQQIKHRQQLAEDLLQTVLREAFE
jgi:type I restriction enzyme S subunit